MQQAMTMRQLTAGASQEPREAPQTAAEEAEGHEDPFAEEERPEQSWWRRWFGFE